MASYLITTPSPASIDINKLVNDYAKQLTVDDTAIGVQIQS